MDSKEEEENIELMTPRSKWVPMMWIAHP
jgi:hypothetical protein